MLNIGTLFNRLVKEDSGQDLIEYALVAALIGLGSIAALTTIGTQVTALFTKVGTDLTNAV